MKLWITGLNLSKIGLFNLPAETPAKVETLLFGKA